MGAELSCAAVCSVSLILMPSRTTLHQLVVLVAHLTDEIEFGLRVALLLRQRNLSAGDLHRERNEIAVAREPEIIELAVIERSVSGSPSISAC